MVTWSLCIGTVVVHHDGWIRYNSYMRIVVLIGQDSGTLDIIVIFEVVTKGGCSTATVYAVSKGCYETLPQGDTLQGGSWMEGHTQRRGKLIVAVLHQKPQRLGQIGEEKVENAFKG